MATSPPGGPGGGDGADADAAADASMAETYDALASRLVDRHAREASTLRNGQLFVGIAGGPGSGKSTLAAAVADRINDRMTPTMAATAPTDRDGDGGDARSSDPAAPPPPPACVVLPMDGFHHPRSTLRSMGSDPSIGRTYDELLARRGAPWTFDAPACVAAFVAARESGRAVLPTYDRTRSDPVPDGVRLRRETRIVLLEGNYLLAWDDPDWRPLRTSGAFDETWYVACRSVEEQRERLVRRHLETWSEEKARMWGEGREGAGRKADANDARNAAWIEETSRKHADLIVESV